MITNQVKQQQRCQRVSFILTKKEKKKKSKVKKEQKKSWQMVWTNQLLSAKDKLTEK